MATTSLYLIVAIGAGVAGFVQGLSGFAFGLVAMSFWAWSVEPLLAAVLAVFGALTGQVIAAVTVRRPFDKRLLWPLVLDAFRKIVLGLLTASGVALLASALPALLRRA